MIFAFTFKIEVPEKSVFFCVDSNYDWLNVNKKI